MYSATEHKFKINYEKWSLEMDAASEKALERAGKRKKELWKCDGCAGYENQGCVYNCPTGALQVVVLADLIKTIPLKWAEKIVEYLSPAFLNAGEKELVRANKAKVVVDKTGQILLEML